MPEVVIRYKIMTDKELDSVAEVMADMIIGHIQTNKDHKTNDVLKTEKLQEKSVGTVQPV